MSSKKIDINYLKDINKIDNEYILKKFGNWTSNIDELKKLFINNEPFEHIIIDNFLSDDYAEEIYNEFPTNYENWYKYINPLEIKFAYDNINLLNDNLKNYFYYLSSDHIVNLIKEITGIENIEFDDFLHGAGLHSHPNHGRINIHLDYEKHPISGKERRINIIYFSKSKPKSNFSYSLGASATKDIERANKLLKEKNKLEADAIAKLKAKSEVDKLKDKFDLERIGLTLALNKATDEETKLRLKAQLAILDNNEALAKKLNAELGAKASIDALATAAGMAASALTSFGPALFNALGEMTGRGRNQIAPDEFARLPQGVTNMGAQTAATAAATAQTTATLTLDPNASSDKLVAAIGELVRVNLKYGNKLVPAGTIQ